MSRPAKKKKVAASVPFRPDFLARLRDQAYAAAYLQSVLDEGDTPLLLATLRDLAEAHGGMAKIAQKAGLSRTHFYKMLSPNGNPTVQHLDAVFRALGLRLTVEPLAA